MIEEDGTIKISDFGLSSFSQQLEFGPNLQHTTCGTLNFIAPEIIKNSGYDGAAADVWACGVILFCMLTGERPFDEDDIHQLLDKIVIGEFKFPEKCGLKPSVMELIRNILNPNPRKRFTISQIKDSVWFQEGGYREDEQLEELMRLKELLEIKTSSQVVEMQQKSEEDLCGKSPHPVTLEVNFNNIGPAVSVYDGVSLSSYYANHPGLANSKVQPKVQQKLNAFTLMSQLTGQKMQKMFESKNKKPPGPVQSVLSKQTYNPSKHPQMSKFFFTSLSAAEIFTRLQEVLAKFYEPRMSADKVRMEISAKYFVKLKNASDKN